MERTAPVLLLFKTLSTAYKPAQASGIKQLSNLLISSGLLPKTRKNDAYIMLLLLEMSGNLKKDDQGNYVLTLSGEDDVLSVFRNAFTTNYQKIILALGASSFMAGVLNKYLTQAINEKAYVEQKEVDAYNFYTYITAKTDERVNDADFKKYVLLPLIFLGYFFLEDKSQTQVASETLYLSYFKAPFLSKYRPHLYKYILKKGV